MRQIPPVGLIESALETLKESDPDRGRAVKELNGLGRARLLAFRDSLPTLTNFQRGYLLGLETAGVMIAATPATQLGDKV